MTFKMFTHEQQTIDSLKKDVEDILSFIKNDQLAPREESDLERVTKYATSYDRWKIKAYVELIEWYERYSMELLYPCLVSAKKNLSYMISEWEDRRSEDDCIAHQIRHIINSGGGSNNAPKHPIAQAPISYPPTESEKLRMERTYEDYLHDMLNHLPSWQRKELIGSVKAFWRNLRSMDKIVENTINSLKKEQKMEGMRKYPTIKKLNSSTLAEYIISSLLQKGEKIEHIGAGVWKHTLDNEHQALITESEVLQKVTDLICPIEYKFSERSKTIGYYRATEKMVGLVLNELKSQKYV